MYPLGNKATYTGSIVDFTCAVPQEVSAPSNATVEIAKVTENEINVAIKGNTGELFNFQGTISSDSTFMIEPFVVGTDTFNGIGKKTDKLEIFLGDGCVLFGSEVVTSQFTEN